MHGTKRQLYIYHLWFDFSKMLTLWCLNFGRSGLHEGAKIKYKKSHQGMSCLIFFKLRFWTYYSFHIAWFKVISNKGWTHVHINVYQANRFKSEAPFCPGKNININTVKQVMWTLRAIHFTKDELFWPLEGGLSSSSPVKSSAMKDCTKHEHEVMTVKGITVK